MTSYRLSHDGTTMPTQVIYNELRREYNSRNPQLPDWAKTHPKEKESPKPSQPSSKVEHALLTTEPPPKSFKPKSDEKGKDKRGPRCYGCNNFGHIRRNCPENGSKPSHNPDFPYPPKPAPSNTPKPSNVGQANNVEEFEFAYAANVEEDLSDAESLSSEDDFWNDEVDENDGIIPSQVPLHIPLGPLSSEEEIISNMETIREYLDSSSDDDMSDTDTDIESMNDMEEEFQAQLALASGCLVTSEEDYKTLWKVNSCFAI
jgi:hypothetical protein